LFLLFYLVSKIKQIPSTTTTVEVILIFCSTFSLLLHTIDEHSKKSMSHKY